MKNIPAFIFLALILWGCRDLQEKDIRNEQVQLISPPDKYRSVVLNQTFYWSKVDGATAYRIQIAENNFTPDSMFIVMDSITTRTEVSKSLPYGRKYKWRVMALNGGYDGTFTPPRTIFIDSSAVIAFQTVSITIPAKENEYINNQQVDFKWVPLPQAIFYYFSIDSGIYSKPLLPLTKITSSNYNYTLPRKEGKYTISVVGNDNVNSSKNTSRSFYLDFTVPVIDQLFPDKDSTNLRNSTVNLKWRTVDSSPVTSKVFVFTDLNMKVPYTGYSGGKPNQNGSEPLVLPATADTLYWFINAQDVAGNSPVNSPVRKLFIP